MSNKNSKKRKLKSSSPSNAPTKRRKLNVPKQLTLDITEGCVIKEFNRYKNARTKYCIDHVEKTHTAKNIMDSFNSNIDNSECSKMEIKYLWHGTTHKNIKSIIKTGFDPSLCKTFEHGKGIYFDKRAFNAADFCKSKSKNGLKYMLFCKVLTCECVKGHKSFNGTEHVCLVNHKPPKRTTIYCITKKHYSIPFSIVRFKERKK
eukprot:521734_1